MELQTSRPQNETFAKFYFLLEGAGTLIAWNAILNGLDYFSGKYPEYNADFLLPIAVNLAQVVANFFMPTLSSRFKLQHRIILPLIVLGIILVFLPIEANLLSGTTFGFILIMSLLFILGFFNNIFQGSMSGFVNQFPFKYTSYFLMGTGLAGLIMNALRALAIVSLSNEGELMEIIVYFVAAGLIIAACMVIHPIFTRSYLCKYYVGELKTSELSDDQTVDLIKSVTKPSKGKKMREVIGVFKEVHFFVLLLLFNYLVNFIVFPGVMLEKPLHSMTDDWKVVSMLAMFNLFDIVGKNLAQYRHLYSKWRIFGTVMARMIFIGLFVIQAVTSSIAVFNTVWFGYLNIALFGLTNGFVTTALFILGPEKVDGAKKEVAGFLSIFGLTTGITLGGFLALPLSNLNAHNQ